MIKSTSPRLSIASIVTKSKLVLGCRYNHNKSAFTFYDLVCRTPTHPREPLESILMSKRDLYKLKEHTKTTYEGKYQLDSGLSKEERLAQVFGGRIKGESRKASSRFERGEPRVIAGVTVPDKPPEPDNCCMSGCINCVWEIFNEDIKHWNEKRKEAASALVAKGGRWPEEFHAPLKYLQEKNYPKSVVDKGGPATHETHKSDRDEAWGEVPVSIRVFAETEKRMKEKKRLRMAQEQGLAEQALA